MVIYKRIRDLREDKDLTQKDLANYLKTDHRNHIRDMNAVNEQLHQKFYQKLPHFMIQQ